MPKGGIDPLAHVLSGELGEMSDETPSGFLIEEAVFAGCKNYSILMKNPTTGEVRVKQALRGFTKDSNTLKILSHKTIKKMVLTKKPAFMDVTRIELKRKMGQITSMPQTKRYRPVSRKRATRLEGMAEIKVPFGYVDPTEE